MEAGSHIIGRYDGAKRGPLFICMGAIHGNEPSGVQALEIVLRLLREEPGVNPDFVFHGRMLGLIGNTRAFGKNVRFLQDDMNRILTPENINTIFASRPEDLSDEHLELFELLSVIRNEIETYQPERVVFLDLHSTSAEGGIFVIVSGDPESVRIGTALHAPVILDFAKEIAGTTLGYFTQENLHVNSVAVVFESGQHNEPLSVNRAISAIINCMRTIGCIKPEDVENKHDALLLQYSAGLPKIAQLIDRYGIQKGHRFTLARAFKNFEPIEKGQIIAFSDDKPVEARSEGLILLPRIQEQGDDGFFLVKPLVL